MADKNCDQCGNPSADLVKCGVAMLCPQCRLPESTDG